MIHCYFIKLNYPAVFLNKSLKYNAFRILSSFYKLEIFPIRQSLIERIELI